MKCQECGSDASIHLTEISEGKPPQYLHFCREHARLHAAKTNLRNADMLLGEPIPVTVEVTPFQAASGESVTIGLPDGESVRVPVPKGLNRHMSCVMLRRSGKKGQVYEFHLKLVSEGED